MNDSHERDLTTLFKASRTGALALLLIGTGLSADLSSLDLLSGLGAAILTLNFLAVVPAERRGLLPRTGLSQGGWPTFAFRVGGAALLALLLFSAFDQKLFGLAPYPLFLCLTALVWLTVNLADVRR